METSAPKLKADQQRLLDVVPAVIDQSPARRPSEAAASGSRAEPDDGNQQQVGSDQQHPDGGRDASQCELVEVLVAGLAPQRAGTRVR